MLLNKLYVRIWLAVVLAVAVLTLLVGWAWRLAAEPPLHEVVIRNPSGDIIGNGRLHPGHLPDHHHPPTAEGGTDAPPMPPGEPGTRPGRFGEGPEFEVQMQDGQTMHLHLPRRPASSWRAPFGFLWMLALVAVAVALGTYPIVRPLTRRLESLQRSVEQWGEGNLSARVEVMGNDEVGFLAARFNRAAQQVEALLKARDALLASQKSLLANASHELRSPLTRIRMSLELMGTHPSPAAKEEIARSIGELDALVGEILLASRLDAKEADLGTVEPVDLVGLAAEECAHTQTTLNVALADSELVVPGVSKLLRRAVRNLLENASRYTHGETTLSLSRDAGQAVIQVCDQGPGVPIALQERIFEPFYRLPGASERDGGVGLGLSLVKSIALRHGGKASCHNRPEGGACFEIRLPLQA